MKDRSVPTETVGTLRFSDGMKQGIADKIIMKFPEDKIVNGMIVRYNQM